MKIKLSEWDSMLLNESNNPIGELEYLENVRNALENGVDVYLVDENDINILKLFIDNKTKEILKKYIIN